MASKFIIPTDIEEEAKEYMQAVVSQLENSGVLENVDTAALTMLARNYSTFIRGSKELENSDYVVTSSTGNLAANPLVKIVKDAQIQAMNIMKEFGLTVKSRSKLPKLQKDDEPSPFEQFVKEGKEIR